MSFRATEVDEVRDPRTSGSRIQGIRFTDNSGRLVISDVIRDVPIPLVDVTGRLALNDEAASGLTLHASPRRIFATD